MRQYDKASGSERGKNYFAQGFRLGLVFGTIAALVILGRDNK